MTERAIDRMVELLNNRVQEGWFDSIEYERGFKKALLEPLDDARRLAEEEKAQVLAQEDKAEAKEKHVSGRTFSEERPTCPAKPGNACQMCFIDPCSERRYVNPDIKKPTAPASLLGMPVIESALLPKGTAFLIVQDKGVVTQMQKVYDESERPTPQSEILGELKAWCSVVKMPHKNDRDEAWYLSGYSDAKSKVEEIIRKFDGGVK